MSGGAQRRKARYLACQALYQWSVTAQKPAIILRQFLTRHEDLRFDHTYFSTLFLGVLEKQETLQASLKPWINDTPLTAIEAIVLKIGAYELLFQSDVPASVVLNEAVLTAKKYGTQEGYAYVNAILDRLASSVRHD